jgi:hypothetical protein
VFRTEDDPKGEHDEEEATENVPQSRWQDAPAESRAPSRPDAMPAANEKNAMFAGLCWKLAASKRDTARKTGMNLSMTVRPIVANSAAKPTSQFASAPEATACNYPMSPPISRYAILPVIISVRRPPMSTG